MQMVISRRIELRTMVNVHASSCVLIIERATLNVVQITKLNDIIFLKRWFGEKIKFN